MRPDKIITYFPITNERFDLDVPTVPIQEPIFLSIKDYFPFDLDLFRHSQDMPVDKFESLDNINSDDFSVSPNSDNAKVSPIESPNSNEAEEGEGDEQPQSQE